MFIKISFNPSVTILFCKPINFFEINLNFIINLFKSILNYKVISLIIEASLVCKKRTTNLIYLLSIIYLITFENIQLDFLLNFLQ